MWRDQPNILHPRHTGTAFFLPHGRSTAGVRDNLALDSPQPPPMQPGRDPSSSPASRCVSQGQSGLVESVENPTFQRLIMRYRTENERLRDQVKAHAIHEALLEQHLHELSARNTAFHLQDFRKKEGNDVEETLRRRLEDREDEVRALQCQVREQMGRIAAFEEMVASQSLDERKGAVDAAAPVSSRRTHELLCQALSGLGFLTRVFNAVEHCETKAHNGPECPRPLQECITRCLQAAIRGNQETVGEVMGRGYRVSCEDLALALRDEVLFCETTAVRMAAHLLAERSACVSTDKQTSGAPPSLPRDDGPFRQKSPTSMRRKPQASAPTASCTTRKRGARPTADDCEVQ